MTDTSSLLLAIETPTVIESFPLRCPLGVRFRDTATMQIVASGLSVTAYPVTAPFPEAVRRSASPNRSGVWVFNDLAGLRSYELGVDNQSVNGSPPGPIQFRIEVQDLESRFLPCSFVAWAPVQGLFQFIAGGSPPWPWNDVPLFSAPERPVPPNCAVIRTQLTASDEESAAAWSLVQVTTTVRSQVIRYFGIANPKGSVALMFPWPELTTLVFSSPPGGLQLDAQGWQFAFAAWHDFESPPGTMADLGAILARPANPPDSLWVELSPPAPFSQAVLTFGRELIVPDTNARADHLRQLIITSAE